MAKRTDTASAATPAVSPKKTLKELFEERDRTRPGSREEEEAAKKIAEAVFPDTDADKVQTDYHKYPSAIKQHLIQRFRDRRFSAGMAQKLADWLHARPIAPDLRESPAGWHKKFSSFIVCGEGEFVKTLFTIYSPGTPRKGSTDLDHWQPSFQ